MGAERMTGLHPRMLEVWRARVMPSRRITACDGSFRDGGQDQSSARPAPWNATTAAAAAASLA